MSTKNLARTAIEVGRSGYNKWERNYSHKQERARAKQYTGRVTQDPELADEITVRKRPKVHPIQLDKLNPVESYLRSRVGRKWDDVHSEIISRFDSRTIAGHHILYGHIFSHMVGYWYEEHNRYNDFTVDEDGILTESEDWRSRYRYVSKWTSGDASALMKWVGPYLIREVGNEVFWMDKADPIWGSRRQLRKLTREERSYWDSLHELLREKVIYKTESEWAKDRKRPGWAYSIQR